MKTSAPELASICRASVIDAANENTTCWCEDASKPFAISGKTLVSEAAARTVIEGESAAQPGQGTRARKNIAMAARHFSVHQRNFIRAPWPRFASDISPRISRREQHRNEKSAHGCRIHAFRQENESWHVTNFGHHGF